MRGIGTLCILIIVLFLSNRSDAQTATGKTEILILGTQHLKQINGFESRMLDKLITKLDSFEFDAICVENMPAQLLYDIDSRNDSAFIEVLESFAGDRLSLAEQAQGHLNINFLAAQNEAERILNKNELTNDDRKSLIQYFVASTDLASAVLQFEYLPASKVSNTDSFSNLINSELAKYSQSSNEIYSLAIPLALNQDLQKIEHIDNFQDEAMLLKYFPQFIQDYLDHQDELKDVGNSPVYQKTERLIAEGVQANDLLELFVFINSKAYQEQDFAAQWEIWLKTNFPSGADRARYDLWEMRNLQIAANIMNTTAFYPGKRLLVIIGASHKLFLEKYLRQVSSIELIEFK